MWEFVKDFFTDRDAFSRVMRALVLAVAAGALTPAGQAAIVAQLGPWAAIVIPILVAAFGGAVAVGEKNPKKEGDV
jgi:hypothetical protein